MKKRLEQVVEIAIDAGKEILDVYDNEFDVEVKGDGSPLTEADRRAHELIVQRLQQIEPEIPVLSEESDAEVFLQRRHWHRFWLVDPLDGTREFVKRNGEFTVNIALIVGNSPVLGVVHTPVRSTSHYAAAGLGAFRAGPDGKPTPIRVKKINSKKVVMVASRSHAGEVVETYRARLANEFDEVQITSMGSSLKICLVAEGLADIYPRLGLTSEWDTAAAHCVLEAAGGSITTLSGQSLTYNKENILNPWFLAGGDPVFGWVALASGLDKCPDDAGKTPVPGAKTGS